VLSVGVLQPGGEIAVDPAAGLRPEAVQDQPVGVAVEEGATLFAVGMGPAEAVVPAEDQQGVQIVMGLGKGFGDGHLPGVMPGFSRLKTALVDPALCGEGVFEFDEVLSFVVSQYRIGVSRPEGDMSAVSAVAQVVVGLAAPHGTEGLSGLERCGEG
jgi:hypothetical protein